MTAVSSAAAAAAAAETALRNKLFSDNVDDEEDIPDSKKEVFRTVLQLLERTVLQSEGNSLLIVGPRGSGKTWVLNKVFQSLKNDKRCKGNYMKVYLNGFVHTNDRLALLDIAQQLDIDSELGEQISMSFSAALEYLLSTLRSGSQSNQSVIFVLDEFDQFAHHKNQSLLYNLLDISQSPHNPTAVVGLTCRLDVVELLEKRVKSRFSHRQLLLFPLTEFSDYVSLTQSLLTLPHDFSHQKYRQQWNKHLKELLEDVTVLQTLQKQFMTSSDVHSLKKLLLFPVSNLSKRNSHLSPSDFLLSHDLIHGDSLAAILKGLSVLELSLLVAVRQISELTNGVPFNFEMVYSEYKKFAQRARSIEIFSQAVALKAFDNLLTLELLVPVTDSAVAMSHTTSGGQRLKTYTQVNLVIGTDQISRAVRDYHNCPTELLRWATSRPTKT